LKKQTIILISIILISLIIAISFVFSYEVLKEPHSMQTQLDPQIGFLFPVSGDFSSHGNENMIAANMALEDFNGYLKEKGATWRLDAKMSDSQTSPEKSLQVVKDFHDQGIQIIIGPQTSAELSLIKPYADVNGMLILSPSSTAPSLALKDNIYRLAPVDTNQGRALSEILRQEGIQSVLLLTRADTWGNDLAESITDSFDGTTRMIPYNPNTPFYEKTTSFLLTNLNKQLEKYDNEQVAIIMLGFAESREFMNQAAKHPEFSNVLWFGSDSNANEKKITDDPVTLNFAKKVDFRAVQFAPSENTIKDNVETRITEITGGMPSSYSFSSYDAVWVIGKSIEKTNSDDPTIIGEALRDVSANHKGALGSFVLNEAGDLDSGSYDVWSIVEDEWKIIDTIDLSPLIND